MAKKIKKKTKVKIIPILIFLLLLLIVFFLVSFFMKVKIKNICVYGNKILSDQEIIELAKLQDYPSFLKTTNYSIEKRVKENPYVEKVKVKKGLISTIKIYITEYKILFINESNNRVVIDTNLELDETGNINGIPSLVNYIPDTIYKSFIEEMKEVDSNVLNKISEIEYSPNDYDKQRFLLYMNDGNKVYLTISRFNVINKYNEIYPSLEGKKGILYLDSGNHFEIKE
ncbi:MAG: FtsQ-type POTRA domain-containing protein [Bacilli bacterium]|nr:FtsQ-type POTRA domain-containing protein [Bacilli bacterium]